MRLFFKSEILRSSSLLGLGGELEFEHGLEPVDDVGVLAVAGLRGAFQHIALVSRTPFTIPIYVRKLPTWWGFQGAKSELRTHCGGCNCLKRGSAAAAAAAATQRTTQVSPASVAPKTKKKKKNHLVGSFVRVRGVVVELQVLVHIILHNCVG